VGRSAGLSRSEVERIIGLVKANGWTWRENGTASYLLFPPNNSAPPMTLRHSRSGAFLTYRELRNRGIEADPMRASNTLRNGGAVNDRGEEFREEWLADEGIREDKPLPDGYVPTETARKYMFSAHALERLNERRIHVYEVYAAIDNYDYGTSMRNGHSDYHLFVRGAVEVVVHKPTRTIVTVIDLRGRVRDEPRQPFAPQPVTTSPEPEETMARPPQFIEPQVSTPDAEEVVPVTANKPGRKPGEIPYTDRVREHLANLKGKTITTIAEIHNAVPGGSQSGIIKLLTNLRRLDYVRTTRNRGEYVIVKPNLIAKTAVSKEHIIKIRQSHLAGAQAKAQAVVRGEMPSVRQRIEEFLTTVKPGDEFGRKQVREMLGDVGLSTVAGQLRKLTEDGVLVEWAAEGQYLYALRTEESVVDEFLRGQVPGEAFSISDVMTATGTTISRGKMRELLDDLTTKGVLRRRGGASGGNLFWEIPPLVVTQAKAPAAEMFDDDEDVEPVEVGFEFTPLPDSAIYDVAAVVKRHYDELKDHPGNWVRVSVYEGARGADVAKKRAAKVDEYLDDRALQFVVRAISEEQVGLFVRYRASVR
jgi:hypothetical protein